MMALERKNEQWFLVRESFVYQVSDLGNVRKTATGLNLKKGRYVNGDEYVTLIIDGRRTMRSIKVLMSQSIY